MNLLDSRTGRAIRALRRGACRRRSVRRQTPRAKLLVFIYAAVLAGLSGWLYAHFQRAVNPTPFGIHAGIEYLFMAVVGGAGHVWGAVLGAGIVVILKEILQSYPAASCSAAQGQLETIVFGVMLVLLLQLAPTGRLAVADGASAVQARAQAARHLDRAAGARPAGRAAAGAAVRSTRRAKQFGGVIAVNDVIVRRPGPRDRRR